MDTLDENEVHISEVQVGLCDNMIGTTSTIQESYESYDSKDDTFIWEPVEKNNESFDIPQQRDAPKKDCKEKTFQMMLLGYSCLFCYLGIHACFCYLGFLDDDLYHSING